MEHSVSKGNNQGTKKNGIPAALKNAARIPIVVKMVMIVNIIFLIGCFSLRINAEGTVPTLETVDGNLQFLVEDGKRVGYQIGVNGTPVFLDNLSSTDQVMGQALQMMYTIGKLIGLHLIFFILDVIRYLF